MSDPTTLGPYVLLQDLAAGGMGRVILGEHRETGERVALKTVRVKQTWLLESIRREIHSLARLRHPAIVSVLDHGVVDGLPWYAMELVEGRTLREVGNDLRSAARQPAVAATATEPRGTDPSTGSGPEARSGTVATDAAGAPTVVAIADGRGLRAKSVAGLSPAGLAQALTMVRRLCAPLAFLHGEGIVHRDLKPDNVIVRPDGCPVLVDFGLASTVDPSVWRESIDVDLEAHGTPAYMAPEQAQGRFVDARADLYALGCTLYELITGRPPFFGNSPLEVVGQHLRAAPVPPSHLIPGVPAALDELVLRLLAKSPKDRVGHADLVARALLSLGAREDDALPSREDEARVAAPAPRAYLYRPGLVGRGASIEALSAPLATIGLGARAERASFPGLALLEGESGVGKTRVLLALAVEAHRRHVSVIACECLPRRGEASHAPLSAFARLFVVIEDRCKERGLPEADRLLGRRGKILAPYYPPFAELDGQSAYPEPAELPPHHARQRVVHALTTTLCLLAESSPHMLILDDLQWADEISIDALRHLVAVGADRPSPLFVVGSYRREECTEALRELREREGVRHFTIERFGSDDVREMVADMLGVEEPPRALVSFLCKASEGNPFFIAEYLRTAVNERLLDRDALGRWVLEGDADPRNLALPRSIHELVDRRLSGLSPAARHVVRVAATIGREMRSRKLQEASGFEESEFLAASAELVARHVIEDSGEAKLRFVHDKLHEVAYGRISEHELRALHHAVASALETDPEVEAPALARHWQMAGDLEKSRSWHLKAARRATERYAHREAEDAYRSYLSLVVKLDAESVRARIELAARVLDRQGRWSEALTEFDAAVREARALGERKGIATGLRRIGQILMNEGRAAEASAHFNEALAIYRDMGDLAEEGRTLGDMYFMEGNPEESRAILMSALDIHRAVGNRRDEGVTMANLGVVAFGQGQLLEAKERFEGAREIHRAMGERHLESIAILNLAVVHAELGHAAEGLALNEEVARVSREIGHRHREVYALLNLGWCYMEMARWDEALARFKEVVQASREMGDHTMEADGCTSAAMVHLERGEVEGAVRSLDEALAIARSRSHRLPEAKALDTLAAARMAQGQIEDARTLAAEALAIARALREPAAERAFLFGAARIERRLGNVEAATEAVRSATALRSENRGAAHGMEEVERGHLALATGQDPGPHLEALRSIDPLLRDPKGTLGRSIVALENAIRHAKAGGRLVHGEEVDALPPGLRTRHSRDGITS